MSFCNWYYPHAQLIDQGLQPGVDKKLSKHIMLKLKEEIRKKVSQNTSIKRSTASGSALCCKQNLKLEDPDKHPFMLILKVPWP